MATLQQLTAGTVFARDYRVIRPLAEGGMGAVYVAEQLSTGNRRALKLMHPQLVTDARSRERFLMEARLGSQIGSAHVVEVTAAGVDEETSTPWLAMELLEGTDLSRVIAQRGALDTSTVHDLIEQLGDALGRAHAAGIVHRDLKPENLFLATSRLKGVPFVLKVLDFGIAKIVAEHKTAATVTTAIGSPLWMAPEQANRGARVRPATDVWALGLIVFNLLTGKPFWINANVPEDGFNLQALLVELMVEPIVPASQRATQLGVGVSLPYGFDAWFARCVHRDADQRFADGAQAVAALLPLLVAPARPSIPATMPLSYPPGVGATSPLPNLPVSPTAAMGTMAVPGMSVPPTAPVRTRSTGPILAGAAVLGLGMIGGAVALTRSPATTSPSASLPASVTAHSATPEHVPVAPPTVPAAPAAVPSTPAPVEPAPTLETSAANAAHAADTPRQGEIEVRADPWCNVTLDGTPMGMTPRVLSVRTGRHTLTCTKGADTRSARVTVHTNRREQVSFSFAAAQPTPQPTGGNMDELLQRAVPQPQPSTQHGTSELPETPNRTVVLTALRAASPNVRACGNGNGGVVTVNIVFANSGNVTSARAMAGGSSEIASCAERAVRGISVPPFRRETFSVTSPFALR